MSDIKKIVRLICKFLETRLKNCGFACELIRAFETPGIVINSLVETSWPTAMVRMEVTAFTSAIPQFLFTMPVAHSIAYLFRLP